MDTTLLRKLICINCYKPTLYEKQQVLVCSSCGQNVSLFNGIPDFLSVSCVGRIDDWGDSITPYTYELNILKMNPYRLIRIDRPLLEYVQGEVLEIGCGTCRLATPIEKRGAKYFGLDPSLSYLLYAQKYRNLQRLVCGQGERLPFQDKSFDCIVSGFYAYRFVNPELGLPEAHRVLRKGGKFVFDLLNWWILKLMELKSYLKRRNWRSLQYFDLRPRPQDTFEFINLLQLEQKARKAGFLVEKVMSTPVTPIFPVLNKYLSNIYFRGKRTVYLGYDVIIALKAI